MDREDLDFEVCHGYMDFDGYNYKKTTTYRHGYLNFITDLFPEYFSGIEADKICLEYKRCLATDQFLYDLGFYKENLENISPDNEYNIQLFGTDICNSIPIQAKDENEAIKSFVNTYRISCPNKKFKRLIIFCENSKDSALYNVEFKYESDEIVMKIYKLSGI